MNSRWTAKETLEGITYQRTYAFRHQDGIHFTRHGGAYMAKKIYNKIFSNLPSPRKKDK